ncbi:MAG: O-antigen ligase family protein [Bacteroides sp.]|nr:O-antigen ligase family protein [Bacteroides sp.]
MSSFIYIFILSVVLFGSITVGPLSIRVYVTSVMMLYLVSKTINNRSFKYIPIGHSLLRLYIAFLVLMGFSLMFNGEIFEYDYFRKLLAYHLVCIVAFLAIERFVNNYINLQRIILLLSLTLLLNNIVTILQYFDSSMGWAIGMAFDDIESNIDYASTHETMLGASQTPGIFGGVVRNAFYIAVIGPLVLTFTDIRNKKFIRLLGVIIVVTSVISCFMTQQRTAFALILLSLGVCMYSEFRRKPILVLLFALTICGLLYRYRLSTDDLGRFADNTDDMRRGLYVAAIDYIAQHPIFGGPMEFQRTAGLSSHNLILDSWIFAGFGGFIIMLILFIKTIIKGVKTMIVGLRKNQDGYMIFTALSALNATLYGLLHNTSYLTGDVIIFISLSIMLKVIELRNNKETV